MKQYDIVMIGHISKDIMIYREEEQQFLGGGVSYSSAAACRSGARVLVVTRAAAEDAPLLDEIRSECVDVELVESPETTSIENTYLTADRERRELRVLGRAAPFQAENIPRVAARIYDLTGLFRGEIPDSLIEPLSKRGEVAADAQGLVRCIEEGTAVFRDWDGKRRHLPRISYFKADAAEAEVLTGTADRDRAARMLGEMGAREVVLTHSSEVIACVDGKLHRAPFRPANLSGRTGRGDTCFAAYLAWRLQHDPAESVRYAAALTSMKMESPGRFRGSVAEVLERMEGIP